MYCTCYSFILCKDIITTINLHFLTFCDIHKLKVRELTVISVSTMLLYQYLILFYCVNHISASTFNCSSTKQCADEEFVCKDDEDCSVHCLAPKSCENTVFVCPTSTNSSKSLLCQVICYGNRACLNATFDGYYTDNFSLDAQGQYGADSSTVFCPCAGYCSLYCGDNSTESVCQSITVQGYGSVLNMMSDSRWAYQNAVIYAAQTKELIMTASGDNAYAYTDIYCSHARNIPQIKPCQLQYIGENPLAFDLTNIYAINSFADVDISCIGYLGHVYMY